MVMTSLMPPVFAGIRVYALQKSFLLGFITFALSMVPVGANFVRDTHYMDDCVVTINMSTGQLCLWVNRRKHSSIWMLRYQ